MRLSEFLARIHASGDIGSYALWLAAPDRDGVDVDLSAVGRVDVQWEAGQVILYPASTTTDTNSVEPEPVLGMLLSQLPAEVGAEDDFRILVELPLMRDEPGERAASLGELRGVHIAVHSQEVWLLVQPAADFADGLLPD